MPSLRQKLVERGERLVVVTATYSPLAVLQPGMLGRTPG